MLKSMRKSKNRYFYHIFVSPGDAPGAITLNVVWWKENSMLANCLAACAHLTITVSEIQRDICEKIVILSYSLHSTPPLGGLPSKYRHPVWYGKTRMIGTIPACDRQTDRHLATAHTCYAYASRSKNWALALCASLLKPHHLSVN